MGVLSTFGTIFPPPAYMTLASIGVDFSDTSLKYIYLTRSSRYQSGTELSAWGDITLSAGAIVDEEVKDIGRLASVLQEVKKRCGTSYVRISLPEEHAYIFETELKRGMPGREIRGLLEFKLAENVPISPREAYFDYNIVADQSDGETVHAVVTVYAKEKIERYYEACSVAGVVPVSFEVESQAIARAATRRGETGSTMIVDFGKNHTGIGVVYRDALMHTSTSAIGGEVLSRAMRDVLGECKEEELTTLKNVHGLRATHPNKKVRDAILKVIDKITDELGTHIEYWNTREHGKKQRAIARIILCGGSANLAGLPEHLSRTLSVPAKRAEVWHNVFSTDSFVPPIDRRHSYGYATAIGLSLPNVIDTYL